MRQGALILLALYGGNGYVFIQVRERSIQKLLWGKVYKKVAQLNGMKQW